MAMREDELSDIYKISLGLLTDFYQITMAYSYWKSGTHLKESVFHLYFRNLPFSGGYAICCGLEQVISFIQSFKIEEQDLAYLSTLRGVDSVPLFEPKFLEYLKGLRLEVDVDGIEEGRLVFPQEPILRVKGPILQCQLLESALLNIVNFQTLIATKAARMKYAAGSDTLLEFGLRRAQGIDGSLAASRAAYIGGCDATSNLLAGKVYGIPVKGTHAHSWVMSFDSEYEAFLKYAEAMPNNSVFLVDTYNTLRGVELAIQAARWLKQRGHQFLGVRLDSGDLAYLSIEARRLLDEAGFPQAQIVASNDLDEHIIENLKRQGAQINVWGVGTRLVTAYDQPALGGVFKLAATRMPGQKWVSKIKISEQPSKTTIPGIQQVRRFKEGCRMVCDMIFDEEEKLASDSVVIVDPVDPMRRRKISEQTEAEDLLVPIFRSGKSVYQAKSLAEIRTISFEERQSLHPTVRRFLNPHAFPVGLEIFLFNRRAKMILECKDFLPDTGSWGMEPHAENLT